MISYHRFGQWEAYEKARKAPTIMTRRCAVCEKSKQTLGGTYKGKRFICAGCK